MTENKEPTIADQEYIVGLHAKTHAMNKVLSPVLAQAEANAIAELEAAKAKRDQGA